MDVKELKLIHSDERGEIFDCDKLKLIRRKKGTTSADHTHGSPEKIYLIQGDIELTVGDETKKVKAPVKIEIKADQFHKLVAITDISLLEDRSD